MIKKKLSAFTIAGILFCALLTGCGNTDTEPVTKTGLYFDTVISVTLYGSDKESYIDECFAMADRYESYFSATLEDSDVSKINENVGTPVTVHEETAELIRKGQEYYEISGGKFDITIGALTSLWNISHSDGTVPSPEAISRALATVDAENVIIDGNQVTLTTPGSAIDLGGIAKGYIADQMKAYLNSQGITSGLIDLGGNILALGPKEHQDTASYTIGIQKPFADDGDPIAAIEVTDQSVVTSGIYQRYFESDGVLYHHILDTATGYPCDNGLASVTIINNSSVDGDALSTTCFAMGLSDGLAFAESLPDTEAIFITTDGELHCTSGIGTTIPFMDLSS